MEEFDYSIKYTKTEEIAVKECNKIEKVRSRLFCLGLVGAHINSFCFGSISIRYNKNKNSFVITGHDTGVFPKLNPNYYSFVKKVDFKKNKMFCLGGNKPSSEWLIHAQLYNLDPQIKAVLVLNNERLWDSLHNNNSLKIDFEDLKDKEVLDKLYQNIDPFLNNSFILDGNNFSVVSFGKSLGDAEKSLYTLMKKILI